MANNIIRGHFCPVRCQDLTLPFFRVCSSRMEGSLAVYIGPVFFSSELVVMQLYFNSFDFATISMTQTSFVTYLGRFRSLPPFLKISENK